MFDQNKDQNDIIDLKSLHTPVKMPCGCDAKKMKPI